MGDGSPKQRAPIGWGDGELCPAGGRCLWSAYGGWQLPNGAGPLVVGRGVLPSRWSLPMECPWGMAAPNAAGPLAGGTGSCAQSVVAAYGAAAGDSSPNSAGPLGGGRGVLPSWWSLPMECLRGMATPNGAGPLAGGTGSPAQLVVAAYGAPWGDGSPQMARAQWLGGRGVMPSRWSLPVERLRRSQPPMSWAHWLGGQGVLPSWWSLPMERLRGMAAPNGAGPLAGGTGSPAKLVVAAPGQFKPAETRRGLAGS